MKTRVSFLTAPTVRLGIPLQNNNGKHIQNPAVYEASLGMVCYACSCNIYLRKHNFNFCYNCIRSHIQVNLFSMETCIITTKDINSAEQWTVDKRVRHQHEEHVSDSSLLSLAPYYLLRLLCF